MRLHHTSARRGEQIALFTESGFKKKKKTKHWKPCEPIALFHEEEKKNENRIERKHVIKNFSPYCSVEIDQNNGLQHEQNC